MPTQKLICLFVAGVLCSSAAEAAEFQTTVPVLGIQEMQAQVETTLQDHVLSRWFPRALNLKAGGFDQNFSEDWRNTSTAERSVVYQSRLTWLAAQAAIRYPAQKEWRAASNHGADFLRERMWDAKRGGFFWELNQGVPVRDGEKDTYGSAFAIYALSAHYKATKSKDSLILAQKTFRWLEAHAHDRRYGGYFEALNRQNQPITAPISAEHTSDFVGTRYGYKSMNTHIHVLEAFTALYKVWPNTTLRSRLREVFGLVRDTIVVSPPGTMHLVFRPDWKPVPQHASYGHDIETAYLLVEAAAALGMPEDERTWKVARALVDHTLAYGLDQENGGFYDSDRVSNGVINREKIWWVQAEALNALLLMHEKYGAETRRYGKAFVQQWKFIQKYQIDNVHGGFHKRVSETGTSFPGEIKSDGWTEGYHQGRALMNVATLLKHLTPHMTPKSSHP